jgi:hypothetical protein
VFLAYGCKKNEEPSVRDLLLGSKWQVTYLCGSEVSEPYTYTFQPNGQLIQEQDYMNTIYSTWSLINNDEELVIGGNAKKIVSLTETELKLREVGTLCYHVFKAVPL